MYYDDRKETLPEAPVKTPLLGWQRLCLTAANYMEKRGWTRNSDRDIKGQVCLRGALRMARELGEEGGDYVYSLSDYTRAMASVADHIGPRAGAGIPYWNDNFCTSKEEAVALLRKSANSK